MIFFAVVIITLVVTCLILDRLAHEYHDTMFKNGS